MGGGSAHLAAEEVNLSGQLGTGTLAVPARPAGQGSVRGCHAPSAAMGLILANSGQFRIPDRDRRFPGSIPGFAPPFTRLLSLQKMSSNVQN